MTADAQSGFPYEPIAAEGTREQRRRYWGIARGLQAVDGLETSEHLNELSEDNINGVLTLDETGKLLRSYHDEMVHAAQRAASPSLDGDG